jgi:large conductance mechanosensitive channel
MKMSRVQFLPRAPGNAGKGTGVLKDFKAFILRGNVVDLAVAVVVGAAFTAVITALVKDLITPLIAAIVGQPNFGNLSFALHHSIFHYGDFINALVSFLIEATAVFFFAVVPLTKLIKRLNLLPAQTPAPPTKPCPHCLSDIPEAATRCAFCTSEI